MSGRVRALLLFGCVGLGALQAPDAVATAALALEGPYATAATPAGERAASVEARSQVVSSAIGRKREAGPTGM